MECIKSTQGMTGAEIKFWERYAELLRRDGVAGKKAAYMILRAQDFAYSLDGRRLKSVQERDIERWLEELVRNGRLEGWQLVQAHKAVRFLLTRLLPDSDVPTIDWNRLLEPLLAIDVDHPTLIREKRVEKILDERVCRMKVDLAPEAVDALKRLRKLTRTRNMAIRTEQTYAEWAERFLIYYKGKLPEAGRIGDYLDYLALERKVASSTQAQALNAIVFI